MKLKIGIVLALLVLSPFMCFAQSRTNYWSPNGTLSLSLQERYIAIRVSRVLYDELSLWSDLNVNLPAGFHLNVWEHHGLDSNVVSKQRDELDLTFGWRGKLPSLGFEVGLSTTYLNNTPVRSWLEGDGWAQAMMFSKTYTLGLHILKPQIRIEWISPATDIGSGAYILMPNLLHTWRQPLGIKPLSLAHQIFVVHDDGFDMPRNDSDGYFLRWNAGLRWKLSKRLSLTLPNYISQIPIHVGKDGRGRASSWGTTLSFSF